MESHKTQSDGKYISDTFQINKVVLPKLY